MPKTYKCKDRSYFRDLAKLPLAGEASLSLHNYYCSILMLSSSASTKDQANGTGCNFPVLHHEDIALSISSAHCF